MFNIWLGGENGINKTRKEECIYYDAVELEHLFIYEKSVDCRTTNWVG